MITVTPVEDGVYIGVNRYSIQEALQLIDNIAGALAVGETPPGCDVGDFELQLRRVRAAVQKLWADAQHGLDAAVPRQRR